MAQMATSNSGLDLAVYSVATAAQLAAAFAPVPYLAPAVGLLVGIIQLAQNVPTNRRAVKQLGGRCEVMLLALRDDAEKSTPSAMSDTVTACEATLQQIRDVMIAWAKLGKLKSFMMQAQIADDVQRCHQLITDCVDAYNIKAHREIQNWQAEFQINQKRDQDEIMSFLSDMQNQQAIENATRTAQYAEIKAFMTLMQDSLGNFEMGDRRHIDLQSNLYGVQRQTGQLLPHIDLRHGEVRRIGSHPVGGSPAFDIWEGEYLGREKCAIKVIRGIEVGPDVMRRFQREVEIWRSVWEKDRGRYILPFYGLCQIDGPYPYMVSPWMRNGDALSYVKKYPYVDRKPMIRRIAEGIKLLHTHDPPIAHGDIKAANILIDDNFNPLLADFGLSKMMEDITGVPFTQSRGVSESYRWFAPELCCGPGIISTRSDIFSFGMTILELITGEQPFSNIRRTPEVLIKMQNKERPIRPYGPNAPMMAARGLDDNMWDLLNQCWTHEPENRPTIERILAQLP
ncbi:kinase-like protein [Rickenella mellea]|uniref:Kinase-like protein n=1 Tax=Rickenella mellea TaxID=50990 RepID=A0A4Y7QEZ5_9AGAM|nr:kinase-like protein [Rickenella mellea]